MIAISVLLMLTAPPPSGGNETASSLLTGQSGASIELVAVGDGDGVWWDRQGRRLPDVGVTLERYPGDEAIGDDEQFREFLFRFRAIPSSADAGEKPQSEADLRNGWPLGLTADDSSTISYRNFVRPDDVTTDTVADNGALLFAKRVFFPKQTKLGSVSFYMPTSAAVVEAELKVDSVGIALPNDIRGQFDGTSGPVAFRLEVRSERPAEVKSVFSNLALMPIADWSDRLSAGRLGSPGISSQFGASAVPENSFAFAEIKTVGNQALEDAYELRGSFTRLDGTKFSNVSGFYEATSYGDVDFSESLQPKNPVWLNHVQFAVQQVGANGLITGGGANAPIVYGPRSEVTFELRRRPFETVTFAKIALEPRIE